MGVENPRYPMLAKKVVGKLRKYGLDGKLVAPDGTQRDVTAFRWKDIKHEVLDTKIKIGDTLYMANGNSNPQENDRLKIGNDSMLVVMTEPFKPAGGTIIFWYVWARKG